LLQETPLAQQRFRVLGSCGLVIPEGRKSRAGALQMVRHPVVHPCIGARQFPVGLLQQIGDRRTGAHG
jgi:hypothetical protein